MNRDQKDNIEIGKRIRHLRKYYQLKQEDFAKRIKIHQSTLALFESGDRLLKDIYVKMICNEFDCDLDWLLFGKGDMIISKKHVTLEEYAKKHDLSNLEREIIKTYMEIDKDIRKEIIGTFSRVFMDNSSFTFEDFMIHDKKKNYNIERN
jgi:transcriptional regulator with XRE-family HTH domain